MVADLTSSINATKARARILTLSIDTCLVLRTVRVDNTLRAAVGRRPDHFWQAGTMATVPNDSWWIGVWSARVGVAWIVVDDWFNS